MKVKFITHGACLTPMTTNKIDTWTEMFGIPHGQNGAFLADDVRKRNFFHDWLNWRSDTFGHNAVKDWDLFGPFHPFWSGVANGTAACPCSHGACPVVPNSAQKCDTAGIIDECSNNGQAQLAEKMGIFLLIFQIRKTDNDVDGGILNCLVDGRMKYSARLFRLTTLETPTNLDAPMDFVTLTKPTSHHLITVHHWC